MREEGIFGIHRSFPHVGKDRKQDTRKQYSADIKRNIVCRIWVTLVHVLHFAPISLSEDDDENRESYERHKGESGNGVEHDSSKTLQSHSFLVIW